MQNNQNLTNVAPGSYTVTATLGSGCEMTETFFVGGDTTPISIQLWDIQNATCTAENGAVTVSTTGGTMPFTYTVDNQYQTTDNNIGNLPAGTLSLSVTDANGCTSDTTFIIGVDTYSIQLHIDSSDAWCDNNGLGGSITVDPLNGTPLFVYQWNGVTGTDKQQNLAAGSYDITVTDAYGCTGQATVILEEIPCCNVLIPSAFTPNADGVNDVFLPVPVGTTRLYDIKIFNRYGQSIFRSLNPSQGWDGTWKNEICDVGAYFYTLTYSCEKSEIVRVISGDITLIR